MYLPISRVTVNTFLDVYCLSSIKAHSDPLDMLMSFYTGHEKLARSQLKMVFLTELRVQEFKAQFRVLSDFDLFEIYLKEKEKNGGINSGFDVHLNQIIAKKLSLIIEMEVRHCLAGANFGEQMRKIRSLKMMKRVFGMKSTPWKFLEHILKDVLEDERLIKHVLQLSLESVIDLVPSGDR